VAGNYWASVRRIELPLHGVGSGTAREGMVPGFRAGPPFTPIVGCRRLMFEAGSHDPANGRSGGRGEPSPAPSHPTAPSLVEG